VARFLGEQFGSAARVGDGDGGFFEQKVGPVAALASLDLALRGIEEQLFAGVHDFGRQPGAIDGRDLAGAGFAAGVGEVDCKEQRFAADARTGVDAHAATTDHDAAVLRAGAELGETVGEGFEQRMHQREFGILGAGSAGKVGDVVELIGGAEDIASAAGVELKCGVQGTLTQPSPGGRGLRCAGVEGLEKLDAVDDVGATADGAVLARAAVGEIRRSKRVALGEECGGDRGFAEDAALGPSEKEATEAWMCGKSGEFAAEVGDVAGIVDRAEESEEAVGVGHGVGRRGVEPGEVALLAKGEELEQRFGEIAAEDFGRFGNGSAALGAFVPESPADARGGAARAAGALVGGSLRDGHELEAREAGCRRDLHLAGLAGIDHGGDAIDRERGFGDVRGEDDFAAAELGQRAVLLLGRQVAEEGEQGVAAAVGKWFKRFLAADDFAGAGEEDEDVARCFAEDFGHQREDGILNRAFVASAALVADLDGIGATFGVDDRTIAEQPGDGFGGESCAHHDDAEIRSERLADPHQHAEDEVHIDSAFVEFVENDGGDVVQRHIVEQAAEEDAGGHHDEAGVAAGAVIEADLVADFVAEGDGAELSNAASDGAGGESARLDEDHLLSLGYVVENGGGNERGLAGAGGSGDDNGADARDGDDFGEDVVYRKFGRKVFAHSGGCACWTDFGET
jgi:hypothetical protein